MPAATELTPEQKQSVVELKYMQGWPLLLDALQARIDTVSDRLATELDGPRALRILAMWQALREVAMVLKWTPENLAEDLEEEARAKQPEAPLDETASPAAQAQVFAVLKKYHAMQQSGSIPVGDEIPVGEINEGVEWDVERK